MNENDIREPIQKRSIEKKEKIIKSGFDLICKKGYYNTNTVEIAKAAGVSTGIIYNYFKDKHDILLAGIEIYATDIFYPMLNFPKEEFKKENLEEIIKEMIKKFIKTHKLSESAHEEITAMIHSDQQIAKFYQNHEIYMTDTITEILKQNNFDTKNLKEKVHISIGLIDNLCHEIVYHKHDEMNYNVMTDIVINTITNLIK